MGAEAVGGMEYPTLITTRVNRLHRLPPLRWGCSLEAVTVHEVAHQYAYALVASDETEQPWLDEGLATYLQVQVMKDAATDGLLSCPLRPEPWVEQRVRMTRQRAQLRPDRPGWEAVDRRHAFLEAYTLPALGLASAEHMLDEGALLRGLRRYVATARWRHATPDLLRESLEAEADRSLDWLFDDLLGRGELPDWAVSGVDPSPVSGSQGPWTVVLVRRGEVQAPVIVEMERADGVVERWEWDGAARHHRQTIAAGAPPVRVEVDPDASWAVEISRENNLWTAGDRAASRGRWWLERWIRWAAGAVGPWS
jgi:hypothetical protein